MGGMGRYESTVGQIVYGTGRRGHCDDGFPVPSRPAAAVNPVPSGKRVKPRNKWYILPLGGRHGSRG